MIYFQNTIRSNPSLSSVWTFESLRGGGCDPESPSSHSWHSEPLINALGSRVVQPFSYCKLLWKFKKKKKKRSVEASLAECFIVPLFLSTWKLIYFCCRPLREEQLLENSENTEENNWVLNTYGQKPPKNHFWQRKKDWFLLYINFFFPQTRKNKCPLFSLLKMVALIAGQKQF